MKKHLGSVADVLFITTYLIMPYILSEIRNAVEDLPEVMYRIGTFSVFLYPLACTAIIQRIAIDDSLKEGLRFLQGFLWRWYTWPLGILFWTALLFHSVWMSMSFSWGEMFFGSEVHSRVSGVDAFLVWFGIAALLVLSMIIIARLWGLDCAMLKNHIRGMGFSGNDSIGFKIFMIITWLLLGPIALLIILSLVIVAPFYLYTIIWGYALSRSVSGDRIIAPVRDSRTSRGIFHGILFAYTILMAYFFDAGVELLVSRHGQGAVGIHPVVMALLAMAMFYFPFRLFFALSNRRNIIGWLIFALSVLIVYLETMNRFAGGS